ncbi:PucR family transcriptional regulator [Bacillota bacterium Lsc_1132]
MKSLQEATKCLQFIRSYKQKNAVIHYQDLGVQRLLLQNSEEELMDYIYEILGPIMEYDYHRKGDLLVTLLAYLQNNQNIKEAAESISIHFNTLTYRLKKIEQLLGLDLTIFKYPSCCQSLSFFQGQTFAFIQQENIRNDI